MRLVITIILAAVCGLVITGSTGPSKVDAKADKFLKWMAGILREPPKSDQFGISRVLVIHKRAELSTAPRAECPDEPNIKELAEGHDLIVGTVGNFEMTGRIRAYLVRVVTSGTRNDFQRNLYRAATELLSSKAKEMYANGKSGADYETQLVGEKAGVTIRSVRASGTSCGKCHVSIPKGKPIGFIALITMRKH